MFVALIPAGKDSKAVLSHPVKKGEAIGDTIGNEIVYGTTVFDVVTDVGGSLSWHVRQKPVRDPVQSCLLLSGSETIWPS